jgi:steroid delta-isomerase
LGDENADANAIRSRLQSWTRDFNAGDALAAYDLFAADLIASFRGQPDRGKQEICEQIAAAISRHGRAIQYQPDIREVIVSGDLAVVRLIWTLAIGTERSSEPGLDVFRRQSDGKWRIAIWRIPMPRRSD